MIKYMRLEWRKLDRLNVWIELSIYFIIMMFLPTFFINVVLPEYGQSFTQAIELNSYIQMGIVLFGGSLINHVFIEQYKNKTMALSFGYPISRKTLFTAKILFIAAAVFAASIISFILSGLSTYVINLFAPFIEGPLSAADVIQYAGTMLTRSLLITVISFVPLFLFGIWKRAVVPTIVCSIGSMQLPNFSSFLHVHPETVVAVLAVLGAVSLTASILTAEKLGEV
ncbi:ABC transporter permease [Paenibacillus camelliae]|uniref:ABC transporter permease n=1 Tax=Paenibacillus camelliae TaxID=512410 RepID=UPI002040CB63|nr:ABC transporter permease [Paenibacillus camelliae]MCM3634326.1 ABC transporter permease [Paenibacillus camelliae]